MRSIAFVIVSWNAREYLRECLTSLRQATSGIPCEVIVVDNASTDGSPDLVRESFPEVRLLCNDFNAGFALANNQGIEASESEYVCMVNSDVFVFPDAIEKMRAFMDRNPSVGLLGPKVLNRDRSLQPSCRTLPTLRSSLFRALALDTMFPTSRVFGQHFMTHWSYDSERDVEVLSGCFWFARRAALEQVGSLDTRFFMYGEDIDLCRRVRSAGWRITFYPEAEIIHYGGGSSSNAPARFWREMQKANLQYWLKHNGVLSAVAFQGILVLHHLLRVVGFAMLRLVRGGGTSVDQKLDINWQSLRWLITPVEIRQLWRRAAQ